MRVRNEQSPTLQQDLYEFCLDYCNEVYFKSSYSLLKYFLELYCNRLRLRLTRKKMKVLMLLEHNFPPDIRVEKEINSLIDNNYEVILACTVKSNETVKIIKQKGLTVIHKKIPSFIYKSSVACLKFPLYFHWWQSFLSPLFQKHKFDAIHIHDLPLAKVGILLKNKYHIPLILDLHENYPFLLQESPHTQTAIGKLLSSHQQWLDYEIEMLNKADFLISIVQEQKDRIVRLGVSPDKIFIVSNTPALSDLDLINQFDESPASDKFVFIYAGNIDATRGIDTMIKAFNKADLANAELWIVGDTKRIEKQRYASPKVIFYGWQSMKEIYRLLLKSNVALLPHLRNKNSDYGIPNKLFQYMLAAKPVIANNCPAIERIFQKCNCGIVYKDGDCDELSEKMKFVYENYDEVKMKGLRGQYAVKKKFNWSIEEKELLKLYQEL